MRTSVESVLREAVSFEAQAFDGDASVSGADLVEWFADWRCRARTAMRSSGHDAMTARRHKTIRDPCADVVRLLRDLNAIEGPGLDARRTARDAHALIYAVNNGGLQLTVGSYQILVFRRRPTERR